MAAAARRLMFVLALIALGWFAAKAQGGPTSPDFEIRVDAPGGSTTVTCVRGCNLAWVERGVNPNAIPQQTFEYSCTAARCSSARVGGWIVH